MRTLGRATASTAEDPFGPGDPVEVARLVRRALAAGRAHAWDVRHVVLVVGAGPPPDGCARFIRRALGPRGTDVPYQVAVMAGADHGARLAHGSRLAQDLLHDPSFDGPAGSIMVVAVGPGSSATALHLG